MGEKKRKGAVAKKAKKRQPRVMIPLPFGRAVEGLLGVKPSKKGGRERSGS